MAIDYSKWDHIELSDDSDIEVHPNVDKRSFIRWKQQDIHEKRNQRNQEIKQLEVQVPMYIELNRRVDQMLEEIDDEKLGKYEQVQQYLSSTFDGNKPEGVEDDGPTYNEMIEDLMIQLKGQLEKASQDPNSGENLRREIKLHKKKIDDVLAHQQDKLKTLYKERDLHISSSDVHTGWDRSFINKGGDKEPAQAPAPTVASEKETPTKTQSVASPVPQSQPSSSPSSSSPSTALTQATESKAQPSAVVESPVEEETIQEMAPATVALSKIPVSETEKIKNFLKAHPQILTSNQKDALLMSAFDAQFAHDDALTKQIISHSTLMQYIIDLIKFKNAKYPQEISIIIDGLFSKMFASRSNPAFNAYEEEVNRTFEHIKQRAAFLSAEREEEGEQEIQLKSLDDNTELIVNLPDPSSDDPKEQERCEIFSTLPSKMQEALMSGSLDAVNAVFHGMPIEEAENILEIFDACGAIGVQAVLENESEWNQLKDEYANEVTGDQQKQEIPHIEELDIEESFNTADIVD